MKEPGDAKPPPAREPSSSHRRGCFVGLALEDVVTF